MFFEAEDETLLGRADSLFGVDSGPFQEDMSSGSSPFSNEEWEEWMRWDGTTNILTPQQSSPEPRVITSSDQPYQPDQPSGSALTSKVTVASSPSESIEWAENQSNPKKRKSLEEHTKPSMGPSMGKDNLNSNSHSNSNSNLDVPHVTKRSHTIIEKRYRNNLNQKFTALRESVPSLRADSEIVDLGGLVPASKLNKATVLSKAIEYILYLEKRISLLEKENSHLRRRTNCVEQKPQDDSVNAHRNSPVSHNENPPSQTCNTSSANCDPSPPSKSPEGLIRVPDAIRNLRPSAPQEHYAHRFRNSDEQVQIKFHETGSTGQQGSGRGKLFGKVMIGSLAGLMIVDGFSANEKDVNTPDGRGLWALPSLPLPSLTQATRTLCGGLGFSPHTPYLSSLCKLFLVFLGLAFALFLYLFSSKPKPSKKSQTTVLAAAPSPASPLEVRQKAWLTSIQTVWVPRHQMIPELLALHLEALRYVLRQLIGWPGYSWLTGGTKDDEIARVRAWDIAIDAQLTGGDAEVSKSRLVLTILASGTLPSTPTRLMLKALHVRILLWEASKSCWSIWYVLHKAAAWLARHQWLLAQKMNETPNPLDLYLPEDRETLPEHLAELLKFDSDELFTKSVVQRAYNLAWSRPTGEDTEGEDIGIDIVVEDSAIRSPLDALAAWASASILRQTLIAWYEEGGILRNSHKHQIEVALKIAPPASSAYVRALAAKAVFFEFDRRSNIVELLKDLLPPKLSKASETASLASESAFVDSYVPEPVRNDVRAAMRCAAALGLLSSRNCKPNAAYDAVNLLAMIYVNANSLSLLGFAAAHQLLLVLAKEHSYGELASRLNYIRSELRIWINGPVPKENGLDVHACRTISAALDMAMIKTKPMPLRRFSTISYDTGYGSMSDECDTT